MGFGQLLSTTDVAASGLAAERLRMEIATNNIANANTTSTPEGGPFRRQQVVFSTVMDETTQLGQLSLNGVEVAEVLPDQTPFERVHMPGHPDADDQGNVLIPNVSIPMELVDLMTASRAFEANLKSLKVFKQMAEQAISLIRAG